MGAYAYCQHKGCESPLAKPTLFEIRYGTWEGGRGHRNQLHEDTVGLLIDYVEDLLERVEALEKKR